MNESAKTIQPVFVVGMNGSGTTMLLDNMGRHPDLYAFPRETRILPYLLERAAAMGDLSSDDQFHELWNLVRTQGVFELANDGQEVPLPDDWRACPRDVGSVLNRVFGYFAEKEGKTRWCEKTPQYVQHIGRLAEVYPQAKFIHMIRDGRDSAASFNRRWKRTPELTIFRWKKVIRDGRRQGELLGSDRYIEVHYEHLTTDTETWLRRICEFLQVDWNAAVLESSQPYLAKADKAEGEPKSLVPNSGKWRKHFSPSKIVALESIAGAALHEFGYETEQPAADRDLSRGERKRMALRDNAVQFGQEVQMKLLGRIERPWSVILSRPMVAIRQNKHNRY